MKSRARRQWTMPLALTLVALSLAGCVSTTANEDTGQLHDADRRRARHLERDALFAGAGMHG